VLAGPVEVNDRKEISMRFPTRLGFVLVALTVALAAAGAASAAPGGGHGSGRVVFVMTDNPSGNQVVAYDRVGSGALKAADTYSTGGNGGVLDGSVTDHTASQGALTYDASSGLLFAVNAGSSTVSVFRVSGDQLTLTQVVSSGGTFPVSIATRDGLVYVLNALGGGSVQGFTVDGDQLQALPGSNRALGLNPSATPQFTNTPGQVAFSPDGSRLIVTTKANTNAIDVFSVDSSGSLSASPVVNVEAGTVPFAVTFDPSGNLVVAEAGTNALATYSLNADNTVSLLHRVATGQAATCWVVSTGSFLYASNTGSGSESRFASGPGGALTLLGTTPTDAGTVDAAATPDGAFLYVQTGAQGNVDGFRINGDGSLTAVGSVTVPGAAGGEGIVAL
jgi:6-phosphogluconolactonase (cycloisomerase 2 family)